MMTYTNYAVDVFVDGKQVTTYLHNGQFYIEGRKGKNYQLRLCNNSPNEVEFVVSVDGLSITDGKKAGKKSRGYILRSYQTAMIDGWLLDQNNAAAFKFGDKSQGYAAKSSEGDVANSGVIGVMVFTKKYEQPYRDVIHLHQSWNADKIPGSDAGGVADRMMFGSAISGSIGQNSMQASLSATTRSRRISKGGDSPQLQASNFTSSVATEFGEKVDMKTTKTTFERSSEAPAFSTSVFYGDAKDLNKLGIVLEWQKKPQRPNPFPADDTYGCKPPVGWSQD